MSLAPVPEVPVKERKVTDSDHQMAEGPSVIADGRSWIRQWSLIGGTNTGEKAREIVGLRISFEVRHLSRQTPNAASIVVTNPNKETVRLFEKEFQQVILQAGYRSGGASMAQIFRGQIKDIRVGRAQNATDTYLAIEAADSDMAYNQAITSKTLAAGYTDKDVHAVVVGDFKQYDLTQGFTDEALDSGQKAPRGRAIFGMTRDVARDLATSRGMTWSIYNGAVQFIGKNGGLPQKAIILNARTGMIGIPQQTFMGITLRTLLDPRIQPDCAVKIDQASVARMKFPGQWLWQGGFVPEGSPPGTPARAVPEQFLPDVTPDGFYRVAFVDHRGDTRGNDWYSEITCFPWRGPVPPALLGSYVPPSGTP